MSPSDFRDFWSPAFDDVKDGPIQKQLDLAVSKFNVARWGADYTEGLACFVAHGLKWNELAAKNPTGGDGLSKTIGRMSVTKDSRILLMQMQNYFNTTMYGRRYMFLVGKVGQGAIVAGIGSCLA